MSAMPMGDPFSAFASSFGGGLGKALGGDSGPFVGGSSSSATYGTNFTPDHSGWTINIGSGSASTNNAQTKTTSATATPPAELPGPGLGLFQGGGVPVPATPNWNTGALGVQQAGVNPLLMLLLGGTALVMILKKGKKS